MFNNVKRVRRRIRMHNRKRKMEGGITIFSVFMCGVGSAVFFGLFLIGIVIVPDGLEEYEEYVEMQDVCTTPAEFEIKDYAIEEYTYKTSNESYSNYEHMVTLAVKMNSKVYTFERDKIYPVKEKLTAEAIKVLVDSKTNNVLVLPFDKKNPKESPVNLGTIVSLAMSLYCTVAMIKGIVAFYRD